jgi:hypothetical protein
MNTMWKIQRHAREREREEVVLVMLCSAVGRGEKEEDVVELA